MQEQVLSSFLRLSQMNPNLWDINELNEREAGYRIKKEAVLLAISEIGSQINEFIKQ